MKTCKECKVLKELTEYYKTKARKDGLSAKCKECIKSKERAYRTSEAGRAVRLAYRKGKGLEGRKTDLKRWYFKRIYGISIEDVSAMIAEQGNLCAICKQRPEGIRPLAVDHCHKTGKVRAMLCDKCNRGIGFLRDSPEIIQSALDYVIHFNAVLKPVQAG